MPGPLQKEWGALSSGWKERLSKVHQQPWFEKLDKFLDQEVRSGITVFPPPKHWFRALHEVEFEDVRVVIIGQDPYHGEGQATGLSFAVPNPLKPKPPSLLNIFKEIAADTGEKLDPSKSDLSGWSSQGVLLLNTILTVRKNEPLSHQNQGWEQLTDTILRLLNDRSEPLVFLLWGAPAQKKEVLVTNPAHLVLRAPHPSPLSSYRGFLGCKHFTQTNQFLKSKGLSPIHWSESSRSA
ncbi:MAG: uracil-DNA glycosylase [Bdellovibrionales bacterium]|nr:uracil-DNA glycosylase [Bdellovibrionales bacterium]